MRPGYELRFKDGDVVYWCHHNGNANYEVKFGRVDTQFSDAVVVDYLVAKERRLIDGVPIEDFESETRYRKLPKGWSYDTRLFELTLKDYPEYKDISFHLDNPEEIENAYDVGMLVKDSTIFHGNIESEIEKEGFRIVKKYPMWQHHIDHASIRPDKLYFTYEEAKSEVDANIAEFMRQAALSDYDWSVEQIDNTLNRWQKIMDSSDKERIKYREWILGMKNVVDIETRIFDGNVQWKYWKNKKWNYIEL